ncbi:sodium:calcium antiporter [Caulobacter sp. KR2-114]|uniref:sodium:calcium antiporter n=1 Tax=Caulobacter sp. KR2-114 TaxID=3400912 RepID=UPI003C033522
MQSLPVVIGLLLANAVAIYLACEVFVNGVEWVGRKYAFGEKATGTILAAAGTALPESVVTFVAVVFGVSAAQKQIGVGAALGGPLVLGTIAYAVVGAMLLLLGKRGAPAALRDQDGHLARDQLWFLVIFLGKIGLGLVAFAIKPWLGLLFLAAYGAYFWKEMRGGDADDEEGEALEPLKLAPGLADPPAWLAVVQTLAALVVIFICSKLFVGQLDTLGPRLGMKPQLTALLFSPIATELPEILNAVIWLRQGKTRLALCNISGAMMIQATVPSALGILFTPWLFDGTLIAAGAVTAVAVAILLIAFRLKRAGPGLLASMAGLYLVFGALVVGLHL